jgi:hypothetical protein
MGMSVEEGRGRPEGVGGKRWERGLMKEEVGKRVEEGR